MVDRSGGSRPKVANPLRAGKGAHRFPDCGVGNPARTVLQALSNCPLEINIRVKYLHGSLHAAALDRPRVREIAPCQRQAMHLLNDDPIDDEV
jgi:hypothetical protein